MALSEKVIIWQMPDGIAAIQYFDMRHKRRNQGEGEFIDVQINKLKAGSKIFTNLKHWQKTRSEIRQAIASNPKGHKRRLRISNGGTITVDPSIKLPQEIALEKRNAVKLKLTSGQPLTEEEADFLFGR